MNEGIEVNIIKVNVWIPITCSQISEDSVFTPFGFVEKFTDSLNVEDEESIFLVVPIFSYTKGVKSHSKVDYCWKFY